MTRFSIALIAASFMAAGESFASEPLVMRAKAELEINGGNSSFAPYYIASNRHGTLSQARGAGIGVSIDKQMDLSRRFTYGFGVEGRFGATNRTDYDQFRSATQSWGISSQAPANAWLQQLYAEVKFRGVFLEAGLKEQRAALVNEELSSGDLVHGINARPMPGAQAGFVDFQNIPFTNGWVQIQGELGYWKYIDNDWQKHHFSFYNYHVNLGSWHNYKRCFFRTKPSEAFSLTIGMQAAAQFSGTTTNYHNGQIAGEKKFSLSVKDFIDMIVLREGDDYWKGNHVGSWDIQGRYRLKSGDEIKLYAQWLWEDGSGIGKLNGWDGLWGIEWKTAKPAPVSGVVVEVLSFMNQSGPLHYDPADIPGTTMTESQATGADNYYNNTWYNGYAYYGMSLGSPMFISPIYNTDGFTTAFVDNRFWGIHAGISGTIIDGLDYRVLGSWRKFYGTMMLPRISTVHDFSAMAEASWMIPGVPGMKLTVQAAFDAGNSPLGNRGGMLAGISYSGLFNCNTKKFTPCGL